MLLLVASVPDPVGLGLSTVGAVMPAIFYSVLVLSVDRFEKEPWRALLGTFAWGAVVAVVFSVVMGTLFDVLVAAAVGPETGALIGIGLGAPIVEETFKGLGLLGLLLMFRNEFDNVLDGLVYGALVGLGFAMTENILYFGTEYIEGGFDALTELFIVRAVLGGFGHALYTGTTGAALGWARSRHGRGALRFFVPLGGWALAVFQHFLWNSGGFLIAAVLGEDASLLLVVLVMTALFTLPALLTLLVIAVVAGRRESRIIREQLADEVQSGVLTQAEYQALGDGRSRRRASWDAYRHGGLKRWRLQRRFAQAAAELAFRKYHLSQGELPKGDQKRTLESGYRAELASLRARLGSLPAGSASGAQG